MKDNIFSRELTKLKQSKRLEKVVEKTVSPVKVKINGTLITLFNTNDYLGLRLNPDVAVSEHKATKRFGSGAGAVRFISGTTQIHKDLEARIASFHGRESTIVFSSAFMANLAAFSTIAKTSPDDRALVLSDELNHRSIIDGLKLSGLEKDQKQIYRHLDYQHAEELLDTNVGKFDRALIISDGVFSMLGETANLRTLHQLAAKFSRRYKKGVLLAIDDCHGVGVLGRTGRGCEEIYDTNSDILIGTLGKGFGVDGGYVTGSQDLTDFLREKAASYIFSSPLPPGTAGAALRSIEIASSKEGARLRLQLNDNIAYFKSQAASFGLALAKDSSHPIQPLLIGSADDAQRLASALFENARIFVTAIGFPAVAVGQEEIRIQITAKHSSRDIDHLVASIRKYLPNK